MTVTISEFAKGLNVPYTEAYMLLKALEKQGSAHLVGTKRTGKGRGRPARVYAVSSVVIDPKAVVVSRSAESTMAKTETWFVSAA